MEIAKLISADECETMDIRRVPLSDILTQHRARWVVKTSIGDFLLRRIRHTELEKITLDLLFDVPEYKSNINEAITLKDLEKFEKGLDETQMLRYLEIGKWLEPYHKRYLVPCIVEPKVTSVDEVDALLEALDDTERNYLYGVLSQLGSPNIDDKVSLTGISIAQEFHIPLAKDLDMENMTAQQATALGQACDEKVRIINGIKV
jgi:hypothetical protein